MNSNLHIIANQLSKNFLVGNSSNVVLKNLNFQLKQGEFVSIIGASGSGKTSLLKLLSGLLEPSSGYISINNTSPNSYKRNKKLGFVSQNPALLPWSNVEENINLALKINRHTNQFNDDDKVKGMLKFIKLEGIENYYPDQLSGGMKQRVSIARSIIYNPELLIMDEPLSALDEFTRDQIRYEILALHQKYKPTIIFSTHNIFESVILSDKVFILSDKSKNFIENVKINLPRPRIPEIEYSSKVLNYVSRLKNIIYNDK